MGNDGSTAKKSPTKEQRRERSSGSTDGSTSKAPESRKKRPRTTTAKASRGPTKGGTNPFLIFFLRVRSKKPNEHVTVIARKAGKAWARMTPNDRQKYVDLANAEKRRRERRQRKQPKNKDPEPM